MNGSGRHQNPPQGPYGGGPYNNDPYYNGPYNNGPYNNGSYNNGPQGNGPYNHNPYNSGPYNNGPYNNGPYNNPYNPYDAPRPPKQKNGFATTSLICGIIGLLNLCCFSFPTAIVMGVAAISFAVISKKGQALTGTAIAGIVLGVFAIILGIVEFFYSLWLADLLKDPEYITMFNQLMEQFEQQIAKQAADAAK